MNKIIGVAIVMLVLFSGCSRKEELDRAEIEGILTEAARYVLERTTKKPGGQPFAIGTVDGEWIGAINNDPKTFNEITARDGDTNTIVSVLFDYLADYDPYTHEWLPNLADFEIEVNEATDSMRVIFTLRDDIYWTTSGQSRAEGIQVTSDDPIFWYNRIEGNQDLQHPGYAGQFINLPDGTSARVTVEKIDERRFAFIYPRIVANPILSSNMFFGPRHIYEPALDEGGIEGVLNVLSIDTDVTTIPSIGQHHIVEYTPGVRVVLQRNPNYWKQDETGTSLPYSERIIMRIVPDLNSEYLLFKEGTKDSHSVRPEDLDELIDAEDPDYAVYNGGATLGAAMISFNQNPDGADPILQGWFIQTPFRQAMSSLLNRVRIAQQIYRGLAMPARHFFARPNPYFDEDIRLEYTYDPPRAIELLAEIGIERDDEGLMRDAEGNAIEFDLILGAENNVGINVANIFADELEQVGITLNVRPIDFQKLVENLTVTYDWDAVLFGGFVAYWPSSGSNVWQSSGNFHIWHPLQETPATEWEARIDELYNEGRFTVDIDAAKTIYDEYQRLLLEQVPVLHIVHQTSFLAVRDRWDNVFYDTLNGLDSDYLFLKP